MARRSDPISKQSWMNAPCRARGHALLFRCSALLWTALLLAMSGNAGAQSPVGTVNLPPPDNNAYSTSLGYDSNGNLYAWDGLSVWKQSGGTGSFSTIGSVAAGNSADAGPISFSQNGQSLLLSNGAGGASTGVYNGGFWTMPAAGGSATQVAVSVPYTGDAAALPSTSTIPGSSTKYIVYEGNSSWNGSSLSVLDASTGTDKLVIDNGPGATASIAINPKNGGLYVGIGYGSDAGNIYCFSLGQIDAAYASGTPINFTSGTLFNPTGAGYQNGGSMFFDSNGYLFSGGDGITVFRPDGTICYNQPSLAVDNSYDTLTYDPANNEVLKAAPFSFVSPSLGTLYHAAAFESAGGAAWSASGTAGSWKNGGNWSPAAVPSSGTATFTGPPGAAITVTLDGNQAAGALVFNVAGSNGYTLSQGTGGGVLTLGASTGASITVFSGTHTISAPIVLAGSLAVSTSEGGSLQLGNVSQAAGVSAALSLSGDGQLILNGTQSYTGGTTVDGGTLYVMNSGGLREGTSLAVGAGAASLFDTSMDGEPGLAVAPAAIAVVPEPGTWGLLAAGATVLLLARVFRRPRWIG